MGYENKLKKWFHIKGKDISIYKPEGKVLTFWLWGETKDEVKAIATNKRNIIEIEWIREETPPFI